MKKIFSVLLLIVMVFSFSPNVLAEKSPQIPIAGASIPQWQQALPQLNIGNVGAGGIFATTGNRPMTIRMCEFRSKVLPDGAVADYQGTWVWGYLVDPAGDSTCAELIDQYSNGSGILDTYTGPVIVNERGSSTDINFVNDLGTTASTNVLAYKYSTDQTIHWADPLADPGMANECMMKGLMFGFLDADGNHVAYPPPGDPCAQNYDGPIAAVPHLHGGEVPPQIDGGPDSWATSDGQHFGSRYYTAGEPGNSFLYKYPNDQSAAPLWFHDHTLGATRLNVYAGLAGGYYIEDPAITPVGTKTTAGIPGTCRVGCLPANLQPLSSVIPLVLQDRMFDTNGQLFFPADSAGGVLSALNPEHPYWVPEFIGDTIVVNGKAWPFLKVEPKRYRFLFLEGSNARPYNLTIDKGHGVLMPFQVIGTDGGYLDKPAATTSLLMLPGERYEVILDFSGIKSGTNLVMKNDAGAPYPDGDPVDPATTAQILQFRVGACTSNACGKADKSYNPATNIPLRSDGKAIVRLAYPKLGIMSTIPDAVRVLTLNEIAMDTPRTLVDPVTGSTVEYPGGPEQILVNNSTWAGENTDMKTRSDFTPFTTNDDTINISETPQEGKTEMWEIVNLTMDAHPIHLHLTNFQLINRQTFNVDAYNAAYAAAFGKGPQVLPSGCIIGVFCPAYGPPLAVNGSNPLSGGKLGGNVDIDKLSIVNRRLVPAFLTGSPTLPKNYEAGWLDTVIAMPGQVTRFAVRWAPKDIPLFAPASKLYFNFDPYAGGQFVYVWHCHIIDHEDNEMMRADVIRLNPKAPAPQFRKLQAGRDY